MWILKGTLLGVWLFSFGTMAYLYLALFRKLPSGAGMISSNVFTGLTTSSPAWWLALIACLAIGLAITNSWPGKPILWVTLAVTELLPVGLLAMILVLVSKLKQHTN